MDYLYIQSAPSRPHTNQETAHQIHPLKLGTDILASLVSLYFFWQHKLFTGLILHLAPPIIASLVVIYAFDLEPQRQSALGQYVK
jgi:hypothetical protein